MEDKINWEKFIRETNARKGQLVGCGHCPKCGGKVAQVCYDNVVLKSYCENRDWSNAGFGGPGVTDWTEAVRRSKESTKEEQERILKQKEEYEEKQKRIKKFLLDK
jgi:hypothetical protein